MLPLWGSESEAASGKIGDSSTSKLDSSDDSYFFLLISPILLRLSLPSLTV
jgi:hypothetical protein